VLLAAAGVLCTTALTVMPCGPTSRAPAPGRWNLFHAVRTALTGLAPVCLLAAVIPTAPHGRADPGAGAVRTVHEGPGP
jgi:hypothetical protein